MFLKEKMNNHKKYNYQQTTRSVQHFCNAQQVFNAESCSPLIFKTCCRQIVDKCISLLVSPLFFFWLFGLNLSITGPKNNFFLWLCSMSLTSIGVTCFIETPLERSQTRQMWHKVSFFTSQQVWFFFFSFLVGTPLCF